MAETNILTCTFKNKASYELLFLSLKSCGKTAIFGQLCLQMPHKMPTPDAIRILFLMHAFKHSQF